MTHSNENNKPGHSPFFHRLEGSAVLTFVGVVLLFSTAVAVTLIAPRYVDSTWTDPSSPFQTQMYDVEDPNLYVSSAATRGKELQYVHHLKQGFTLLAFKESANLRIVSTPELEKFITRFQDNELKLTSKLLLLREPQDGMQETAKSLNEKLQQERLVIGGEPQNEPEKVRYQILELYDPGLKEAFSYDPTAGILQNWVDRDFKILDEKLGHSYHQDYGVVYVQNPVEFRITVSRTGSEERWRYDPEGTAIKNVDDLKNSMLGFFSRKELISLGEHIYAIEGCWYCHTDQTRTLIQDVVLNGSDSYPAPPSSANEYIYQKITFPGTRRIGPDISRVGVKRPSRDWHKSHFWAPKTASVGSIMPAFQHFFDNDPRGTSKTAMGIPNYQFEAIYQYLMTKGTRITPPTQAWWLGKDPVQTKLIIEGQKVLP